jgi:isopentenyl-diphosphate delta-isomerase
LAFSVGSQRIMLRHPETVSDFAVRDQLGDGVLLGNIGGVQLVEVDVEEIARLVDAIDADGLCVHLNVAQELVQTDGNRKFAGVLDGIAQLLEVLDGRVLVKETGAGLSPAVLEKLHSIGVPYIDVSGSGGTSWTKVESYRDANGELQELGRTFGDWGVPTAFGVYAARRILGDKVGIVAAGGIDRGLDAVRAFALGADLAGVARAVLLPFMHEGRDAARRFLQGMIEEIRMAMLLTGSNEIGQLRSAPKVLEGRLREWIASYEWDSNR